MGYGSSTGLKLWRDMSETCDQNREAPIEARKEDWPRGKSRVDFERCDCSKGASAYLRRILKGYLKPCLLASGISLAVFRN